MRARKAGSGGRRCESAPPFWTLDSCSRNSRIWESISSEISDAKVDPAVTIFSAGVSACKKGGEWRQALRLLCGRRKRRWRQISLASMLDIGWFGDIIIVIFFIASQYYYYYLFNVHAVSFVLL